MLGPDGQPVRAAWMFSRLLLQPQPVPWRRYWGAYHGDVRDGHAELHGLAPDSEVPVYFYDPEDRLGATTLVSTKAAKEGPITVRLEPCGLAMARLVDPKGQPLAGYRDPWVISMIVTPGRDGMDRTESTQAQPVADSDYLSRSTPSVTPTWSPIARAGSRSPRSSPARRIGSTTCPPWTMQPAARPAARSSPGPARPSNWGIS